MELVSQKHQHPYPQQLPLCGIYIQMLSANEVYTINCDEEITNFSWGQIKGPHNY